MIREHKEDIIALAKHFVRQLNEELDREIKGLSFSAEQKLTQYNWPGNIRELRNVIERAILLCTGDLIEFDDLLLERTPHFLDAKEQESAGLKEMERQWLIRALEKTRWNQTQAARLLKISRFALLNRIKKFNINRKA